MSEENTGALSASEAAYFESGGETEITVEAVTPEPDQQPEAPAPEVQGQQPEPEGDKSKFVPHGALHAEREEHKKTRSELQQLREQQAVLNDRWNTILTAQKPAVEEVKAPPNPEEDIFAYSKWQADQLKALQDKVDGRERQETEQRQASQADQALWGEWSQSAQSFAAEKQDFGDAVKYLSDAREKQLTAIGRLDQRLSTPQARTEQINAELKGIILAAKQNGISPAEAVYQIAKDYGFTAPAPDPVVVSEKLDQIDAAQTASRTLAGTPGKPAGDAMTAEAIASMPAADFDRWYAKPENQQRFNKLMGG